ncbi:putative Calcium-binding EF-hand family protein [Hibiscus syriacus]|uniref:Calcium-binding EF-hand family protein n=1 Tax=Hibiscus syriacus TaxID=106335 RepID=A0A6A3CLG6_HIBSY|nr:putative Calcium-binding EF-hand family protein [Hibiscus syriacus]
MLEYQVPWMVLETLFNLTRSLAQLAIQFFGNMFSSDAPPMDQNIFLGKEIKHIIDLLRMSLVSPSEKDDQSDYSGWQPIPSASKLKEAGVSFKKVKSKSILDIKFNNGVLEIPSLLIQETMETVFRNLISFEQCYPNCIPRLTSYAKLLDNLIDTTDDMEVLCKKDIIDNWLNLDDATKFLKKLHFDGFVKEFHNHDLCNQVNDYCRHWWHAFYMHNYFGKPWAIVSQVFFIIILTLTVFQAVYSIIK